MICRFKPKFVGFRVETPVSRQRGVIETWRLRHSMRNEKLHILARILSSLERFLIVLLYENRFLAILAIFRSTWPSLTVHKSSGMHF